MRKFLIFLCLILFFSSSCSSGPNHSQKGDAEEVLQSVLSYFQIYDGYLYSTRPLSEYPLTCLDFGAPGQEKTAAYQVQIVTPEGLAVSTADAYRGIRPRQPETSLEDVLSRPVEEWDGLLVNDFEDTVFEKYPALAAIKRSLYDTGAVYASMSGSGSALFAIYAM